MAARPPVDLSIEVESVNGARYRWDQNQAPGSRLGAFSFRTKIGDGFSDASGQLPRRIDQDYPDLSLFNWIKATGVDGTIAYEGRVEAMPRDLSDSHSIGVTCAGGMVTAARNTFTEVYVDRDLSQWTAPGLVRRSALYAQNRQPIGDPSVIWDDYTNQQAVATVWNGPWASGFAPISEAWYDAGPFNAIREINYAWTIQTNQTDPSNTGFSWQLFTAPDSAASASDASPNLRAAGPGGLNGFTPAHRYRYAILQASFNGPAGGTDGVDYGVSWNRVAVFGDHGVPKRAGEPNQPGGVYASDVIRDIIARFCPKLNSRGVKDTDYSIPHLVYRDQTKPFDAFTDLNKYHGWHLGVWDDKTVHFRPYNMAEYDWEVRTDGELAATFGLQGDSTADLRNGIVVTYQDVFTGKTETLRPETHPELRDTDPNNPVNEAGYLETGDLVSISVPTTEAGALQVGRLLLADSNRPKAPGTITVRNHIRDRVGNWQPAWMVRAGDRLRISSLPFDGPRLVTETVWDNEAKTMTISVEGAASGVDSLMERQLVGIAARNLSI
jgi:hypothetical protein